MENSLYSVLKEIKCMWANASTVFIIIWPTGLVIGSKPNGIYVYIHPDTHIEICSSQTLISN